MKNPSFKSAENRPLYVALNDVMMQRGFTPNAIASNSDSATWDKALSETLSVWVSITLSRTLPPDTWSIEPGVMVDSRFVAEHSARLRLDRDCWAKPDDWIEPAKLQILRFFPGKLRWQDDPLLKVKVFKGRPETLDDLRGEIAAVFDTYVQPVLSQMSTALGAAEFHEKASSGFLSKRGPVEAIYKVTNPYISTALLFVEAGRNDRALAVLERTKQEKATIEASSFPEAARALFCKIEKLFQDLKAAG